MNRWSVFAAALFASAFLLLGCTGGGDDPVIPQSASDQTPVSDHTPSQSQTHLWGFYDCTVDLETMTVEAVLNRQAMFTANVVTFLNGKPANLAFHINATHVEQFYIDIDIDVTITHPFPGMNGYHGYDVRGIFIGDGSTMMDYNSALRYSKPGTDQYMLPSPHDPHGWEFGKPDGYTRWFNVSQFFTPGMFGYTPGIYASPGYYATATLNPYKYFADSIGPDDFLWPYLQQNQSRHGVLSAGEQATRNYYLRFPNTKGIKYSYAIAANWEAEWVHPSNAIEAIAVDCVTTDDVWFLDDPYNGGEIIVDVKVWDWNSRVNAQGFMEDYTIYIESTVLSQVYMCDSDDMTPTNSGTYWYEYHIQVPADNVQGVDHNEYWIIVQYADAYYHSTPGAPNGTGIDKLAACFRFPLNVANYAINEDPVCDLVIDPDTPSPLEDFLPAVMKFDATGTYDADPLDVLTYEWDFDGDLIYDEDPDDNYLGEPNYPTRLYYSDYAGDVTLRVTDGNTGEAVCSVAVDVTTHPSKNIELRSGVEARDIAIDPTNGDLLVAYADSWVYKYPHNQFYTTGSQFIQTTYYSQPIDPSQLDVAPTRYTLVSGIWNYYAYSYTSSGIYDPSGTLIGNLFYLSYQSTSCDAVAMGLNGDYAEDLCFAHGYIQAGIKHNVVRRHVSPGYTSYANHDYSFPEIQYTGEDKIYFDWVVGCESDLGDDLIWFLEDQDYYASRWELTDSPYDLVFDDAYFGTGEQTDDNDGFWLPRDITRDDLNRLFVLDELSTTDPAVKMWTVDGDDTTSIGSFGDTNEVGDTGCISGAPLRIEGSDFNGDIVVLHGDTPPFMISVFHPVEMPE